MSNINPFTDIFSKVSNAKNKADMMSICSDILNNSKYNEVRSRVDAEIKERDDLRKTSIELSEEKWKNSKKYLKNKKKRDAKKALKKNIRL